VTPVKTQVKICGINDAQGFDAVIDSGAEYIGFNFFPPSPRYVAPAQAAALSARHPGGPLRVALFVKPSDEEVQAVLDGFRPDIMQIYAPAGHVAAIRARFGLPVWRALGVSDAAELPASAEGADALLIEAKPPKGATRPGGNAVTFDWSILAGWKPGFDWLLAGGLTPGNVGEAIRIGHPPVVDVSSGVERAPGVKDPALIRAFAAAARQAAGA
jgi:phosphoribosylanthranilate isomerase